jgi:uncharacterized membrane protein
VTRGCDVVVVGSRVPTDQSGVEIPTRFLGSSPFLPATDFRTLRAMYQLLLVVHVLAGIAWVGGGLTNQLAIQQARQSGGAAGADGQIVALAWMERFIYIPAPMIVLVSGVIMVAVQDAWGFSQPWVYLALTLMVLAGILGGAVGSRRAKRMEELRGDGLVDSPEYAQVLSKVLNSTWLELLILIALVFLMVYKPGA